MLFWIENLDKPFPYNFKLASAFSWEDCFEDFADLGLSVTYVHVKNRPQKLHRQR
jgi:hypothetical protein